MNDVKNIEAFFDIEFSSEQLMNGIEKMNYYSDEIKNIYDLQECENPEKTYILGVLAKTAADSKYSDLKLRSENDYDDYMKICMDIAKDKYLSFDEVKPKLDKFYNGRKSYSNDMQNLENILDQWNSSVFESKDGTTIQTEANSAWIDNWRISAVNNFDVNDRGAWQIKYKLIPLVDYNPASKEASICDCSKENQIILNSKLNIGDVLQIIQNKLNVTCPEIEPHNGTEPEYKPTESYYIDKLEEKIKKLYRNPSYNGFSDDCYKAFFTLSNEFDKENTKSKNMTVEHISPVNRNPNDKNLFCVMARNKETNKFTVWSSYNSETNSLNHGHYDISNLNEASKLMCQFIDDRPLHSEHHQQYKHETNSENER